MDRKSLQAALKQLSTEAFELYLGSSIKTVQFTDISSLSFYRDYVSPNIPVKLLGCIDHWPAITKWNKDYLKQQIGDELVSVAITPNGYADAITDGKFMLPFEKQMKFSQFLQKLESSPLCPAVHYVQKQNSNMTTEFASLMGDVDDELPWATEVFGSSPDAVNFWMGDERAITSMHKDHYENIYCVVRGEKTFTLIPPTDQAYVPYEQVPVAKYEYTSDTDWHVVVDEDAAPLPWIGVDPLNPDLVKYPAFSDANIYTVTVREGESLYLPSLWYHHVTQSHGCIAVNYWYDMQYDIKYNYYQFIAKVLSNS